MGGVACYQAADNASADQAYDLLNVCRHDRMTSWPDHLPFGNQKRF
jgi:hypothetical protein